MEGLGAEVSAKIRSAIKAKLIELEAYVDEELPDYIMVMVANNRNKEQMEDDLGLFLNNNTKAFTNWLHAVLEKLKKVTLDEVAKKESKKKKTKKSTEKSSTKKTSKEIKEKKSRSGSDKKSSKSSPSVKTEKSSKNANLEELGERKKKKSSSSLGDGEREGYNPSSLLKSAVEKSKSKVSPKKSSSKKSVDVVGSERKSKNMINLREEEDFYRSHGGEREGRGERDRRGVSSLVSKVVRPDRGRDRERDRERDRYYERSEERYERYEERYQPRRSPESYTRSVVSRAEVPPRPSRPPGREERGVARAVSRAMVEADRSVLRSRREEDGQREREKVARLSADDVKRYEFLKRRREEREEREIRELKDVRQRERDLRDRQKQDEARIRQRKAREEEQPPDVSPPKKRRLEDDDAELLEMRRKALESLMKRTDKELVRTRVDSGDRKIVGDISSDSQSDSDSDVSLSEADTSKEAEPTFIVTMDGIGDDYFKSNGESKPKVKPVINRKPERVGGSTASSDGELELHADVDFDEAENKKSVKTKLREPTEKPTMKVAARKRSPILPPAESSKQPVAAVKPLQAPASTSQSKAGSATKLAASYAAKLSEIKANKAKLKVEREVAVARGPLTKTISVEKSKPSECSAIVKPKPTPVRIETKVPTAAKPKRVPIKAPSPERSSPSGVSKLSYGSTTSSKYKWSKYKWTAAI